MSALGRCGVGELGDLGWGGGCYGWVGDGEGEFSGGHSNYEIILDYDYDYYDKDQDDHGDVV